MVVAKIRYFRTISNNIFKTFNQLPIAMISAIPFKVTFRKNSTNENQIEFFLEVK